MVADAREQRGRVIAEAGPMTREGAAGIVPSRSGTGKYTACPDPAEPHGTCLDHETRGVKCKHISAAECVIERQDNADGTTTVTRTVTVTEAVQKPTDKQDGPAYNKAQTNGKGEFQSLLSDLRRGVQDTSPKTKGQPRLPPSDAIFAAVFKVDSTVSGRRFLSDLRGATGRGDRSRTPHDNSIFNALENPAVTPILRSLITESSLPPKTAEVDSACESSGFTTPRLIRWFDHGYGVARRQHEWAKVHLMCGVETDIVTAVEIRDTDASDAKLLPDLVDAPAKNFKLNEVSADKGYGALPNYGAIEKHGAAPFIAFKSTHAGAGGGLWAKRFHDFSFRRDDFLRRCHERSNGESTSSMIRGKCGDSVRSKTGTARVNEVLAKVLCHNIVRLIHEMYELGIEPTFWKPADDGKICAENQLAQRSTQ